MMLFFLLINVKMPTTVAILHLWSGITYNNAYLSRACFFIILGPPQTNFIIEKYGNQCYYAITDPQACVQFGAYEMGYKK